MHPLISSIEGTIFRMVFIPEGWFWMGSENRYRWESPRHRVWVDAFDVARTPVTRGDYARLLAATCERTPAGWSDLSFGPTDQPVVGVTWFAAVSYCAWLSASQGRTYRLPTE